MQARVSVRVSIRVAPCVHCSRHIFHFKQMAEKSLLPSDKRFAA